MLKVEDMVIGSYIMKTEKRSSGIKVNMFMENHMALGKNIALMVGFGIKRPLIWVNE
jgi:hypothetical protein